MAVLKTTGRTPGGFRGLSLLVFWLLAGLVVDTGKFICAPASAGELAVPANKVKAAYLLNFARLTYWPTNTFTNASQPFVVGVLGKDPFGPLLEKTLEGKTLEGRPIIIERFSNEHQVRGCHLLFIPASEDGRLSSILSRLGEHPVLTVGDGERFAWRGGMIGLISRGDEIRFEINLGAANKASLELSSKLLRLAEAVLPSGKGKDN